MSELTKYYSIKELFSSNNYVIPIYQRNYTWSETEITQLIQDIVDYYNKPQKTDYYIGSLIAYERKVDGEPIFEIIDGQQRLTTLTILLILIAKKYSNQEIDLSFYQNLNLSFDSRPLSTKTLQYLFDGESTDGKDYNVAIKQGYEIAEKALKKILKDFSLSINDFCSYLFNKVKILRVLVPEDTDLNHYFEIMNSRGEQLEKHEILKAKMLEILDEQDRYAFNLIWEACSNMEKYVQYGFNVEQRNAIFGSDDKDVNKWNNLSDILEVYESLKTKIEEEQRVEQSIGISIFDLLKPNAKQILETQNNDEENPDRFNTVINFANFLLHILRIQTEKDIPLDDKRLIKLFEQFLRKDVQNENKNKEFVKQFGYNLLKGKFLLDKYVIKREFVKGTDRWSLKRLKWYEQQKNKNAVSYVNTFGDEDSIDDINREILMILSMFHVSTPTLVYKHWLNAVLKYVFENSEKQDFSAQTYKEYLEKLAKSFLHYRFLAKVPKDYFEIIYKNNDVSKNTDIDETKLNQGTAVENFIFNYLDYLLWQDYRTTEKQYFKDKFKGNKETLIKDTRITNFEYTFRSSVEHYYPQHPIVGNPPIDKEWLNDFGNLCLISSSKNSRLSNFMPNAKKDYYNKSATIDSIKQRIMMEYESWDIEGKNNTNEIEQHGKKMKEILLNQLPKE
jgi:hypothetical protein